MNTVSVSQGDWKGLDRTPAHTTLTHRVGKTNSAHSFVCVGLELHIDNRYHMINQIYKIWQCSSSHPEGHWFESLPKDLLH